MERKEEPKVEEEPKVQEEPKMEEKKKRSKPKIARWSTLNTSLNP